MPANTKATMKMRSVSGEAVPPISTLPWVDDTACAIGGRGSRRQRERRRVIQSVENGERRHFRPVAGTRLAFPQNTHSSTLFLQNL
jgi:hypothetical protein